MANNFNKEERVAFESILEGFNDAMVISRNVAKFGTNGELMERANDTIWRPMPYILNSQNRTVGSAVTAQDVTQLSVPSRLTEKKNVSWNMNALELRDALQEGRLGTAAYQRLASDINTKVRDVASLEGTLVIPITGAAGDYDDVALAESVMNEQGVPEGDRYLALTTRDYNGLAGNLAGRQNLVASKTIGAYERSFVGMIAGFETYKIDAGKRITAAAAGGSITVATNGAQVRYVPDNVDANGNNVDSLLCFDNFLNNGLRALACNSLTKRQSPASLNRHAQRVSVINSLEVIRCATACAVHSWRSVDDCREVGHCIILFKMGR